MLGVVWAMVPIEIDAFKNVRWSIIFVLLENGMYADCEMHGIAKVKWFVLVLKWRAFAC